MSECKRHLTRGQKSYKWQVVICWAENPVRTPQPSQGCVHAQQRQIVPNGPIIQPSDLAVHTPPMVRALI